MGLIRRSYTYLDRGTCLDGTSFDCFFNSLVRPHLQYCVWIWKPLLKKDEDLIEYLLRRATKLIPGLYDKPYNDRLAAIKVPCMSYRRMQGDMILVYKILCGDNQSLCNLFTINEPRTRGHNCKLYFKPLIQTKIRKHFFSINIF